MNANGIARLKQIEQANAEARARAAADVLTRERLQRVVREAKPAERAPAPTLPAQGIEMPPGPRGQVGPEEWLRRVRTLTTGRP